ncbi:MAG: WYL domain-containing protein [Kofleriaceae bacterium]
MFRRSDAGSKTPRSFRLRDLLIGFKRGRAIVDLATELDVSPRTIKRDLAEMERSGEAIERLLVDGRPGARLLASEFSPVLVTRRESYTLGAVRSMVDVFTGTAIHEDVTALLGKLRQRLSPEEQAEYATFKDRIIYIPDGGTKAYADKQDQIDALLTGVLSSKVVRFAYGDASGRHQRGHLAPFAIAIHKHGLYVLGCRLQRPEDGAQLTTAREVAPFAVERFTDAEHLRAFSFVTPADFDLSHLLHDAFGIHLPATDHPVRIVVEFSQARAIYVRARTWHRSQQVTELPDGRVRITFDTRANLAPIVSWILEWGPHALALEPPALVAAVAAEVAATAARYAPPSASRDDRG